ncbi:hypothetical protein LTR97_003795 [Elasticomyces elasticus]|uniref:Gfo/Idh/MocA-like oxidoreductase N-terminal domain-containing protein n=1 Tax=Elasticomyces elasticus TaxID=574655 RepID=A0AAN7VUJ0_9PEZI|nr:hypothetical protein LTR97_003795 [Elasticomyces elasticus]
MAPPIRISLIGLSVAAKTSWASQGHLPYLLSDRGRERYKIVALLNSSVDAARRAIADYKLGDDVKAYGSPGDLAADSNVELVVCTTRVDLHYDTTKPSLEAGKDLFVEWPLAENTQRARELADLAQKKGVRTMVGLQGRVSPAVLKVKELLAAGTIGKVLSSEVKAASVFGNRDSISEGLAYFLDKKVGGSPVTIAVGHLIDSIHSLLGEYKSFHAHAQNQRPTWTVNSDNGSTRQTTSDVPDLVSLQGTLDGSSSFTADNASLLFSFRTGPAFPGTSPLVWTINGERGEIRVTSSAGAYPQSEIDDPSGITIEAHNHASDEVKKIEWTWGKEWQAGLFYRGRNLGTLYDLFAEGDEAMKKAKVVDFDGAVARHQEIDGLL